MSIVRLRKITVLGHIDDKAKILSDLQAIGCIHLVPLAQGEGGGSAWGPSGQAREALRFLLSTPQKRRQVKDPLTFDAQRVEHDALALQGSLKDLEDERDFLLKRIGDLKPWGDFDLGRLEDVAGQRLWFYLVPHYRLKEIEAMDLRWALVNRDHLFCYVAVIAKEEPQRMPIARTHTGPKPRHELESRLEEVELAIEDVIAERASLSRWCLLFADSQDRLEERAARLHAATLTLDDAPLFAVAGWAPVSAVTKIQTYTAQKGLVLETEQPSAQDSPPTLFDNPPSTAGGQDLVTFYMTPGYWTWDPSAVVLYSFSLFFAMILADAGYAAILAVILWFSWRRLSASEGGRRFRTTFVTLVAFSAVYGIIAGSYFGVELGTDNPLLALKLVDITDAPTMMAVSIVIGVVHVALANLMDAFRLGFKIAALPPVGWAAAVIGGLLWGGGAQQQLPLAQSAGLPMLIAGLALVFLFSGSGGALSRLMSGLLALTNVTNAFGDVMSYLRLFALGLATASLAAAFNGMAVHIYEGLPGLGLVAAALVLIIGHTMNFVLGLMSAVVHGLRLNVIEFFKWGLKEEGTLFRPFATKEH
jgi:V/A-type H+-transporting ATPase subunit I